MLRGGRAKCKFTMHLHVLRGEEEEPKGCVVGMAWVASVVNCGAGYSAAPGLGENVT